MNGSLIWPLFTLNTLNIIIRSKTINTSRIIQQVRISGSCVGIGQFISYSNKSRLTLLIINKVHYTTAK